MDFFDAVGKMALGSRLRRLSERLTEDAAKVYTLYGVSLQPKWFPVFYILSQGGERTVTALADAIGQSHPSVIKIVREMSRKGFVLEKGDPKDRRKTVVRLSKKGLDITGKIIYQYEDVGNAVDEVLLQTHNDLWAAIGEWEYMLDQKSLLRRVLEQKKKRESRDVTIVAYTPKYAKAFRTLNEEWIKRYFKIEASDRKALNHPQAIINKGGYIAVALYKDDPVGVCALMKTDDPQYPFEMAKMAVSPAMQGKNIGWMLAQAIITKAKEKGARNLYLESNTILKPAISLYNKLGFQKVAAHPSPYERSNIQMELLLS